MGVTQLKIVIAACCSKAPSKNVAMFSAVEKDDGVDRELLSEVQQHRWSSRLSGGTGGRERERQPPPCYHLPNALISWRVEQCRRCLHLHRGWCRYAYWKHLKLEAKIVLRYCMVCCMVYRVPCMFCTAHCTKKARSASGRFVWWFWLTAWLFRRRFFLYRQGYVRFPEINNTWSVFVWFCCLSMVGVLTWVGFFFVWRVCVCAFFWRLTRID